MQTANKTKVDDERSVATRNDADSSDGSVDRQSTPNHHHRHHAHNFVAILCLIDIDRHLLLAGARSAVLTTGAVSSIGMQRSLVRSVVALGVCVGRHDTEGCSNEHRISKAKETEEGGEGGRGRKREKEIERNRKRERVGGGCCL